MDLKSLEQLLEIENSKSMREAAEKLYISQSTLSHNLKKIEEELGCQLFDRSRNTLTLNTYGRIMLEHSKNIIREITDAKNEIEAEKLNRADRLSIGVFSYAFQSFVLPNIANALNNYMIESRIQNGQQLKEGLKNGTYDLIFTDCADMDEEITVERLFKENIMVSIPSSSEYASKQSLFLTDLPKLNLFVVRNAFGYTDWFEKVLKAAGINNPEENSALFNEYLYEKDGSDKSHLTSSFIIRFVPTAARRVTIPLAEDIGTRDIYVAYASKRKNMLKDMLDYIEQSQGLMFTGSAFLPYFLFPNERKNLHVDESLGYNLYN
ncbi:MAG: LysR family transcriptional regulator [Lachnospiraceae bacterium]|jgi:DNA-binding transcriptional LysR family regulator